IEVIYDLINEGKIEVKMNTDTVAYHDACRMGRKIDREIFDPPREILKKMNVEIKELKEKGNKSSCCGAGSGIRGVAKDLCIDIGTSILNQIDNEPLISSCPLCVFNFRYVDYKNKLDKEIKYITDYILEYLN
ncbi:MAG: hypothetical protein EU549_05280, partial [Promethearchaeota archaeon]